MAKNHPTTESGERWSRSELNQLLASLQEIKDDPEKLSIVENYLKIWKAATEGRLTPGRHGQV
jgi:hypothetical protein